MLGKVTLCQMFMALIFLAGTMVFKLSILGLCFNKMQTDRLHRYDINPFTNFKKHSVLTCVARGEGWLTQL